MHPDDKQSAADDPDSWCIYRVRLKRGWRSFVQIDSQWKVSKAPPQEGSFGTPPPEQISAIIEVVTKRWLIPQ